MKQVVVMVILRESIRLNVELFQCTKEYDAIRKNVHALN